MERAVLPQREAQSYSEELGAAKSELDELKKKKKKTPGCLQMCGESADGIETAGIDA
jgi:hypothetical protein